MLSDRKHTTHNQKAPEDVFASLSFFIFYFNFFRAYPVSRRDPLRLNHVARRKYSILQSQKMKLNEWFYMLLSGGVRGRYYQRSAAL